MLGMGTGEDQDPQALRKVALWTACGVKLGGGESASEVSVSLGGASFSCLPGTPGTQVVGPLAATSDPGEELLKNAAFQTADGVCSLILESHREWY